MYAPVKILYISVVAIFTFLGATSLSRSFQCFVPLLLLGAYRFAAFLSHIRQKCFCHTTVVFNHFDCDTHPHTIYYIILHYNIASVQEPFTLKPLHVRQVVLPSFSIVPPLLVEGRPVATSGGHERDVTSMAGKSSGNTWWSNGF